MTVNETAEALGAPLAERSRYADQTTNHGDEEPAAIQVIEEAPILAYDEETRSFTPRNYPALWRCAKAFAASELVPAHFRGKPENAFIAYQLALRMEIDPFMLMQNLYVVHGRPGLEAKLVIALVNSKGPFTGPIQWKLEGEGDARRCTAYATHQVTGERCEAEVSMAMAHAEGWVNKTGSKWRTMPDVMLRYRSAAFLARFYCPEVLMGMSTADELPDIEPEATPAPERTQTEPARAIPEGRSSLRDFGQQKPAEPTGEPEATEAQGVEDGEEAPQGEEPGTMAADIEELAQESIAKQEQREADARDAQAELEKKRAEKAETSPEAMSLGEQRLADLAELVESRTGSTGGHSELAVQLWLRESDHTPAEIELDELAAWLGEQVEESWKAIRTSSKVGMSAARWRTKLKQAATRGATEARAGE